MAHRKPTKAQRKVLEAMRDGWPLISQRTYVSTDWTLYKRFSSKVNAMTGYACLANGWIAKLREYTVKSAAGRDLHRTPYTLTDLGRSMLSEKE